MIHQCNQPQTRELTKASLTDFTNTKSLFCAFWQMSLNSLTSTINTAFSTLISGRQAALTKTRLNNARFIQRPICRDLD